MSTSPSSIPLESRQITAFNLFRQPGQPRKSTGSQKKIAAVDDRIFDKPQFFSTPSSDRIAVYDKGRGSYCAYSLLESVNKSGLSRQEAVDWVEGQLVIQQQLSSSHALQLLFLIAGSWGAAAFGIWSLIELLF